MPAGAARSGGGACGGTVGQGLEGADEDEGLEDPRQELGRLGIGYQHCGYFRRAVLLEEDADDRVLFHNATSSLQCVLKRAISSFSYKVAIV